MTEETGETEERGWVTLRLGVVKDFPQCVFAEYNDCGDNKTCEFSPTPPNASVCQCCLLGQLTQQILMLTNDMRESLGKMERRM